MKSKAAIPSEHHEQREFVAWFRRTFPGVRIHSIPNGGYRGKVTALRLKLEGLSPGVPDLFIPARLTWVEMKRIAGGSLSRDQVDWKQYLESCGHRVIVAHGFEDAKAKILEMEREAR